MKIGFIANVPLPGTSGSSIHTLELSKALASIGEEVHLYGRLEKKLPEIENIYFHEYPKTASQVPWALQQFSKDFRTYDIIYERFHFIFNNFGFFLATFLKKPYVSEVHGFPITALKIMWKDEMLRDFKKFSSPSMLVARAVPSVFLKKLENIIFNRSSLIVVTSDGTKDIITGRGIPKDKIKVVPNGVDPNKFNPHVEPEYLKRGNETIVTYVGSLFNEGVNTIIHAAEILKDKNIKFLLVGPGPIGYYKKILKKKRLSNVSFYGQVAHDKIPRILSGSDILLAVYSLDTERFNEGFHYSPIKIFEYLSMGKPTITIRVKQLEHFFKDDCILFTNPDDSQDLAEKILFAKNEKLALQYAKKGRELVMKEHTWEKRAKGLREFLQSLIKEG